MTKWTEGDPWWFHASRLASALECLSNADLRYFVRCADERQRTAGWRKSELAWFLARVMVTRRFGPRTMLQVVRMARGQGELAQAA